MPRTFLRLPGAALLAAVLALTATACDKNKPPPSDEGVVPPSDEGTTPPPATERKAAVPADHPLFGRYEGEGFDNACTADTNCHAAGCSSEVCSATADVMTTCDVPPAPLPPGTSCGCVQGQCIWWNADGATLPVVEPPTPTPVPGPDSGSTSCGDEVCEPPKTCIEYYGIAGPRGPAFKSCEIPCGGAKNKACPEGQQCVTIADGPGQVCRPSDITE